MAYQPEIEKLEQRYAADPGRNFAQLAEAYRRDGRLDQALDVLHMHLQDRPDYVSGLIVLGRCLLEKAEDVEARQTFEHVLTLDAEHIIALKALADIAERGADVEGSRGWLQRLLDVDPMNEDAQEALERMTATPVPAEPEPAVAPPDEPAAPVEVEIPRTVVVEVPPELAEPAPAPTAEAPTPPVAKTVIEGAVTPPSDWGAPPSPPAEPQPPPEPDTVEQAPIRLEPEAPPQPEAEPPVASSGVAETIIDVPATTPDQPDADPGAGSSVAEPPLDATVMEAAVPEPEPPAAPAKDFVIERASAEYDVIAADLEPVELEQSSEADLPPAAAETAPAEDEATLQMVPEDLEGDDLDATAPMFPSVADPSTDESADLPVEPFDSSLGWGTGERISRQISSDDLAEAERAHEDGLAGHVQELPGLEEADVPAVGPGAPVDAGPPLDIVANATVDVQPEPLEGLETEDLSVSPSTPTPPLEGLEPTSTDMDADEPPVAAPEPAASLDDTLEGAAVTDAAVADAIAASVLESAGTQEEPAVEETVESPPVARSAEPVPQRRGSLEGLPLLLPDPEEEPEPEPAPSEPAPVVTETMAEVYAKQGLIEEARDVYRQLLEARPDDVALRARFEELEARVPAAPADRRARYSASASGAQSARTFLQGILAGQVAPVADAPSDASPDAAAPTMEEPDTPLAEAFDREEMEAEEESQGAPTQPAADEMSLASVFGEAPAPAPRPAPGDSESVERPPSGAFSFDEFFGNKPPSPPRASGGTRRRDTMADDEGDDAFRDWLKGLKG